MVKFSVYLNRRVFVMSILIYEPAYDKTHNKTCATSKDSDKPVHLRSMARVVIYPSLDSTEAIENICDQRRL